MHNHPSGDPTPSRADIQMTQAIIEVAHPLGIAVHDHLIVGKARHASEGAEADLAMSALEQSGRYCGHCGFDANDPIWRHCSARERTLLFLRPYPGCGVGELARATKSR